MIIGNLGADPEMRYTANGSAVTTFRVATSRTFTDSNDERREETEWFSVVTWNRLAEICAQYLARGRKVYVEGRIQTRSWDDTETGTKRYRTELIAQEVKFLTPSGGASSADNAPAYGDSDGDIDPDELPF
ncbi:Ssb Single-stranded DNA-binding protein [uncultured Caudovirales phage]|uniref:Single-stranded DNA-binding protein n=2 Tax=uncultured Caudovirales phage TaxID=2100421 RepID=A0A6J5SN87_9CAUD|nr:Ssb Single-stranded DNA-binding protein [uncultured Caudovirales phage]CAB4173203.1 Ssb Single-stranded DNA-binding protein [uncultured Caudovirales phage]CAB4179617.1 Ssb Single-stranded DNA-binding protein [uncultured Caudovirales phage]CAB4216039.1 Ssb Single-stranded DNA-binding protein [uncultured Caudovirales phage]